MAAWLAAHRAWEHTYRTQRQWRISVDDSTIAFGTAACSRALPVLSARAVSVSAVKVSGWSAERCTLRDPAAVLSSDLLVRVCASLSVRELLQCAAVNKAWRRVICPAPPALPSACIWELVDLSGFTIDSAVKLTNHVLPRWGSVIRELNLSGTRVDDDGLRAVVAGCPLLLHLDVSECPRVFRLSCEHPNVNAFTELMLQLYARAKPLEQFTLYMQYSGFTSECSGCGEYCNAYIQVASNSLDMVRRWTVKAESGQDAPEIPTAWLQCELLTVCKNWNFQHSQSCEIFIEEFDARLLASGLIDFEGLDCVCGFCKTPTCQNCSFSCGVDSCDFQVCGQCFEDRDGMTSCGCCYDVICSSCATVNRGGVLCPSCADYAASEIKCGCGCMVYASVFAECSRCHLLTGKQHQLALALENGRSASPFRSMMQCCKCRVLCCTDCDPNPDDGGKTAGMAASEAWAGSFSHPQLAGYSDCTFCCSETCTGLADFLALAKALEGGESSDDEAFEEVFTTSDGYIEVEMVVDPDGI